MLIQWRVLNSLGISNKQNMENMEVIRESDIFNDDSAEVIEVEEKPKDE